MSRYVFPDFSLSSGAHRNVDAHGHMGHKAAIYSEGKLNLICPRHLCNVQMLHRNVMENAVIYNYICV